MGNGSTASQGPTTDKDQRPWLACAKQWAVPSNGLRQAMACAKQWPGGQPRPDRKPWMISGQPWPDHKQYLHSQLQLNTKYRHAAKLPR
jgi:hypothetical protein